MKAVTRTIEEDKAQIGRILRGLEKAARSGNKRKMKEYANRLVIKTQKLMARIKAEKALSHYA